MNVALDPAGRGAGHGAHNQLRASPGKLPTALGLCILICKMRTESRATGNLAAQISDQAPSVRRLHCRAEPIIPPPGTYTKASLTSFLSSKVSPCLERPGGSVS